MRAGTTRVSSKGQVVIPEELRKAARLKEGDNLIVVAVGDALVMKKLSSVTFEEVARPVWRTVRSIGLSTKELDLLIEEAKTAARSRH